MRIKAANIRWNLTPATLREFVNISWRLLSFRISASVASLVFSVSRMFINAIDRLLSQSVSEHCCTKGYIYTVRSIPTL